MGGGLSLGALLGPTGTITDTVLPNHRAALTNALLLFLLFYDFCGPEETFQTLITSPTERQRATLQIIQRVNSQRQDCTVSATAPMSTYCSTASCLHIFVILQIHLEYQVCQQTHFFPQSVPIRKEAVRLKRRHHNLEKQILVQVPELRQVKVGKE